MKAFRLLWLPILLLLVLAGFGVLNTLHAWIKMERSVPEMDSVLITPPPVLASSKQPDGQFQQQIDQFALMALFSKVAYRNDLPAATRIGSGCAEANGFGMPARWARLALHAIDGQQRAVDSCYDAHGLFYETYIHHATPASDPDTLVIAFRGTENFSGTPEQLRDWSSNLSAAVGTDPTQYRYARDAMLPLLEAIHQRFPRAKIYVTGHSLGGGLAQQTAYTSQLVEAAFVFDSTPVTNWSAMQLMTPNPVKNDYPVIFRVNHTKEFLRSVRSIATRTTTTRINRGDYEFVFQTMGVFASHEMGILACHFALRMSVNARFDFSQDYLPIMLNDQRLCPTKNQAVILPAALLAQHHLTLPL